MKGSSLTAATRCRTDNGRSPLGTSGLTLHDRLTAISNSLDRVSKREGLPKLLVRLQTLLQRILTETAALGPEVRVAYR
jgi:hypothetical protein